MSNIESSKVTMQTIVSEKDFVRQGTRGRSALRKLVGGCGGVSGLLFHGGRRKYIYNLGTAAEFAFSANSPPLFSAPFLSSLPSSFNFSQITCYIYCHSSFLSLSAHGIAPPYQNRMILFSQLSLRSVAGDSFKGATSGPNPWQDLLDTSDMS